MIERNMILETDADTYRGTSGTTRTRNYYKMLDNKNAK